MVKNLTVGKATEYDLGSCCSVLFCCKSFGLIGLADLGRKDRGHIIFKSSPAVLPG